MTHRVYNPQDEYHNITVQCRICFKEDRIIRCILPIDHYNSEVLNA